jgi:hypothetical protein
MGAYAPNDEAAGLFHPLFRLGSNLPRICPHASCCLSLSGHPPGKALRIKQHWHAIVQLGHQLVGSGVDDRTKLDGLILTFPHLPKTSKRHWVMVSTMDEVWLFRLAITLPFIEPTSRY